MDHAATTRTHPEVIRAMQPYFHDKFANPSGIYSIAKENRQKIEKCRQMIADTLHAKKNEIYFTAGGSEGDNWALKEIADTYSKKGRHIITTKLEHHGILHTCEYLERHGFEVTYLDVDIYGRVNPVQVERAIRKDTILISVMFANNEIGTIQPIGEIGAIARRHNVLFHTDAVQAVGHIKIDVKKMGIDLLSASAHKFNGPKGIGFLYINKKCSIAPYVIGGGQEKGMRSGTENVAGIYSMAKALEDNIINMESIHSHVSKLDKLLCDLLKEQHIDFKINGDSTNRAAGILNISISGINGEGLLNMLDMHDICISIGSACNSKLQERSHVLLAMGLDEERIDSSVRISIGRYNTEEDIRELVKWISNCHRIAKIAEA